MVCKIPTIPASLRNSSSGCDGCACSGRTPSPSPWRDGVSTRGSRRSSRTRCRTACVYCGNCIEVCPTGALGFKREYDKREDGTWDESRQAATTTVCTFCGVGCNLTLHVQDNEIVKVTSPHECPVAHGNLCIKGRFGWQHVQNR
ncbi:4Fe-4S binding protein [Amycolatopsis sp. cmx-11-12]|uniref:4Fe-4S binding protein n=1 Tax=Amycolatopsis sp. cmx-11-12 TaxID=2785795 RepID=UPI003917E5F9